MTQEICDCKCNSGNICWFLGVALFVSLWFNMLQFTRCLKFQKINDNAKVWITPKQLDEFEREIERLSLEKYPLETSGT